MLLQNRWRLGIFLLLITCVASGCSPALSKKQPGPTGADEPGARGPVEPGEQVELIVSAAVSLTDSLHAIAAEYREKHPNVKLTMNLGASGTLQQQIEQGAPADLFLSAGAKPMAELVERGQIDAANATDLLGNDLVLIASKDAATIPAAMDDLSGSAIRRIAIGQPETVPVGGYAKEALLHANLWEALAPKIVFAKDVRQVLTYVETGNVDAGFVYRTDAMVSSRVKVAITVDPAGYPPIRYPLGLLRSSKHAKEAREFYDYLQTPAAMTIFQRFGFKEAKP